MPDIHVGAQIFDLVFHPNESIVYTGLLTGEIKAFSYDEQGQYTDNFTLRPSKRSCRGLALSSNGNHLWAVGKGKYLHTIDTATGKITETRAGAHSTAINRIKYLLPNLLSTGDDDGVVKLWDPRKPEALRSYTHHLDFISDFLWLEDKKQLVATSGDGTLSVMDVRGKNTKPLAQSEDQEDELLSIVPIKGGSKIVVGTQIGILSIFNRNSGWGDCVDRVPGHPHSIDALCALPSSYPSSHSTILTGSSDGLLRAVQLFPTKLIGVVADHETFPIERIAIDQGGEGRWVGSAGHEEVLRLTNLKEVFEDETKDDEDQEAESNRDLEESDSEVEKQNAQGKRGNLAATADGIEAENENERSDEDVPKRQKQKRKRVQDPLSATKKKKSRNEIDVESSFFSDL